MVKSPIGPGSGSRFRAAATFAIVCAFASAHAQVAVSSSLCVAANADANQNDAYSTQLIKSSSQTNTLNTLTQTVSVTDQDRSSAGHSLTANSTATATWTSAGAGTVTWRNMGWSHKTVSSAGVTLNSFFSNQPVWSYTFKATQDGQFAMNYDIRATGAVFGLLGATITWSGVGGDLNLKNPNNPVCSGLFTRNLVAGQTYTVGLLNEGNVFTAPGGTVDSAALNADFNWSTAPVPEPSSMVGLAITCIGLARTNASRKRFARAKAKSNCAVQQ